MDRAGFAYAQPTLPSNAGNHRACVPAAPRSAARPASARSLRRGKVVGLSRRNHDDPAGVEMSRTGLAIAFAVLAALLAASARAEDAARPPAGGVTSPTGAMIFYLAHGRDGSCGPNCSEWIAAEGVVEWDTFKRLFAFLQHLGDRKAPVVLEVRGAGRSQRGGDARQDHSRSPARCDRRHHGCYGLREGCGSRVLCAQAQRQAARRRHRHLVRPV